MQYPWDGTASGAIATYNASTDDATFRYLSRVYSKDNPEMFNLTASAADRMANAPRGSCLKEI